MTSISAIRPCTMPSSRMPLFTPKPLSAACCAVYSPKLSAKSRREYSSTKSSPASWASTNRSKSSVSKPSVIRYFIFRLLVSRPRVPRSSSPTERAVCGYADLPRISGRPCRTDGCFGGLASAYLAPWSGVRRLLSVGEYSLFLFVNIVKQKFLRRNKFSIKNWGKEKGITPC